MKHQAEYLGISGKVKVILHEEGKDDIQWEQNNLIVNNGTVIIFFGLVGILSTTQIDRFHLGTSSTAASKNQTSLVSPLINDAIGSATFLNANTSEFRYFLGSASGAGSVIREIALFANTNMFARTVLTTPIDKVTSPTLTATFIWTITITQA